MLVHTNIVTTRLTHVAKVAPYFQVPSIAAISMKIVWLCGKGSPTCVCVCVCVGQTLN